MNKKIYVVGGSLGYANWVTPIGYDLTNDPDLSHLILFTGGSDISSYLYGHKQLPCTGTNPERDKQELEVFQKYVGKIPFLGVCRGHQFLSALSGAKIIQDMNHPSRHSVTTYEGEKLISNSLHHQMVHIPDDLIPNQDYILLAWAEKLSRDYIYADYEYEFPNDYKETESVFWPNTQSFSVQGHPEMLPDGHEFQVWCQKQIRKFIS